MRLFGPRELQAALDTGLIRELRILVGALAIAPLIYLALGHHALSQAPSPQFVDPAFATMLAIVAAVGLVFAWWLPDKKVAGLDFSVLAREGFKAGNETKAIVEAPKMLKAIIQMHYLLRLALVESVAVYGLLLAFMSPGAGLADPRYYWVLAPCVAVPAYFALFLWPTEERIRALFDSKILAHPGNQP